MDENGKTCGQTAMERLCREMAECVVERLPAAWCRNHGINDGAPWSQCKGIARADIERRISEAREEDESAGAVSIKREWHDKAAELDRLREAGRIAPEGLSWFCYEDGAPLLLGTEAWDSAGHRLRVVALSHKGRAAVRPWERGDGKGARWVPVSSLRSECPDSWERLRDDAAKGSMEYWDCCSECYECPAKVDGETPDERYSVDNCWHAMQLDIVARARRLAGVGDE